MTATNRVLEIKFKGNVPYHGGIVYTATFNLYNPFIQMFSKEWAGNIHTALLNAARLPRLY